MTLPPTLRKKPRPTTKKEASAINKKNATKVSAKGVKAKVVEAVILQELAPKLYDEGGVHINTMMDDKKKKPKRAAPRTGTTYLLCGVEGCLFSTSNDNEMNDHNELHNSDTNKMPEYYYVPKQAIEGEKIYECRNKSCNFQSKTKQALTKHARDIHANAVITCKYRGCKYSSKSPATLKRHHLLIHEDPEKKYAKECKVEGCEYLSYTNMSYHMKTHHGDDKKSCWVECFKCKEFAMTKYRMKKKCKCKK